MSFHDVRFPTSLSFGALGGPERRTEIVTLSNGFEERNTPWAHGRRRYDAGMGLRSLDDVATLIAFFEARQGQLIGFRWKDWADFQSCAPSQTIDAGDQLLGTGDENQTRFQLVKTYRSGQAAYVRPITKPVHGRVQVSVGGVPAREGAATRWRPTRASSVSQVPPMWAQKSVQALNLMCLCGLTPMRS